MRKSFLTCASLIISMSAFAQKTLTTSAGAPVNGDLQSLTLGPNGPVLLEDVHLIEKLQHFSRERIPERVMHPRGTGAQGYFILTKNISDLTKAKIFTEVNKKTPVLVRFSSVIHSKGSPETARDPRGFAIKFYTEEGNWDLVGNHIPTFFIRDAIKFPDFTHANKPSPITDLQDENRIFDYFSKTPEATQTLTWLMSDNGTPKSYREMDGFGVNTFKFINDKGDISWVKFHFKSLQGIKNLTAEEVIQVQGKDFSHMTRDLYDNIAAGNFPKWDLYVQIIPNKDINKYDFNIFDDTKQWFNVEEIKVGTLVLDRIPANFFQYTESAAFAPSRVIPGIGFSPDKMLQGRNFSYADAQMYRLGKNHQLLPANRPLVKVNNYHIDGAMNFEERTGDTNYFPSHNNPTYTEFNADDKRLLDGYMVREEIKDSKDFYQAGILYRGYSKQEKDNLIKNWTNNLSKVKDKNIQATIVSFLYKADQEYGTRVGNALGLSKDSYNK
ncbi:MULTISPECIES: catalase [Flavobacterium]|uniref:Catalase n=2 Tax=Flavobacterium TaxID=237 RepID=A0AA94F1R0_9FLAO|nr:MULTISPECIES: catalase [Flavobacterium]OXA74934.1 catalase [Flavobacterium columnare] [Flavobacterium columnare NBRC 100251 = ATCC 23463]AMA48675.1 catalase [Flavobacterium covae]AND65205.1 catalase [Flavobacterium covae]OWP81119.1 catalase [Flavobacterium covae]OWP85897.1 catalase [Flavobacterium covae]